MATAAELRKLGYAVPLTIADDTEIDSPEVFSHVPPAHAEHDGGVWVEKARFYSYVDTSNDAKPPTAGELRALGYIGFDANLPDEAIFGKDFHEYATGGPIPPGVYRYVDEEVPSPYPYPKPEPPAVEEPVILEDLATEEPEVADGPEAEGRAAALKRAARSSNPYDARRADGRAWNRGFDSVKYAKPEPKAAPAPEAKRPTLGQRRAEMLRRREEMEQIVRARRT
jgi:hypothetical protein